MNPGMGRLPSKAHDNGMRLSRLVADLLDISKFEVGNLGLEMNEVSLQGLMAELTESMHNQFEQKQLELDVKMPSKLRAVWADRERYTPEGGHITISGKLVRDQVEVSVRDTGEGIRPENQARIFEKFVRLSNNGKRPPGSTGLGLAITKTLVETQGGSIRLESEFGKGSAFTVALPATERPE